jgi:release factor glutamine methyltransferase
MGFGKRLNGSETTKAMKTVLEVVQSTTAFFSKHQIESPRLNAEHLVAHVLRKKRIELYLEFDRPLAEEELAPMRDLVRRRSTGEPLQHLLGTAEFCGRVFVCDGRALIPRPETEQLCELVIADCGLRSAERKERSTSQLETAVAAHAAHSDQSAIRNSQSAILDVGTGSGVIALTLAAEIPDARITAVDVSLGALALARENAERLGLSERIQFFESDLLVNIEGSFSAIIANLPYIAADVVPTLSPEVQRDPINALNGGSDGHELIARLIQQVPAHLEPGGVLALEIGADQAERLTEILRTANFQQIRCIRDLQGVNRFLFATYG